MVILLVQGFEERALACRSAARASLHQPHQRTPHGAEGGNARIDVSDLRESARPDSRASAVGRRTEGEELADLAKGEAETLGVLNEANPPNDPVVVLAVSRWCSRRSIDQAFALIEAHCLDAHARAPRHLTDRQTLRLRSHAESMNPVVRYRVKGLSPCHPPG